eukprot:13283875-Alexandrium_andersonii.AAC.1
MCCSCVEALTPAFREWLGRALQRDCELLLGQVCGRGCGALVGGAAGITVGMCAARSGRPRVSGRLCRLFLPLAG